MRKTGLFGLDTRINVEWPTASDLLQMANNIPTKIKDLKYKQISYNDGSKYFDAFQVILSNGISSPILKGGYKNIQEMQSFNVPDFSLVKRVNGT